jgi:hypothetical protein
MSLPHTSGRSRNGRSSSIAERGVPNVYVKLEKNLRSPWQDMYAKARIRVRGGCYQYLVWRDGDMFREFYLGKKASVTPHKTPAPAELEIRSRGVRKGGKR